MTVHVVISGGSNELVGEIVYKALKKAGISCNSWSECSESDLPENLEQGMKEGDQVVISAMVDGE